MYIAITNQNIEYSYPLVCELMNVRQEYDKTTGLTQSAIEINTPADLFTLDSLARVSGAKYRCLMFSKGAITLVDDTVTEENKHEWEYSN